MAVQHPPATTADLRSPLVTAARGSRRPTSWWGAILVVLVALLATGLVGSAGLAFEAGSLAYQLVFTWSFLAGILLLAAWLRFKEGRSFASVGFLGPIAAGWARFGIGIVTGAASLAAVTGILVLLGAYGRSEPPAAATSGFAALAAVALLLIGFAIQGSAEEIWYRGFLLQTSALRMRLGWAMALQAALFGVSHAANPGDFSIVALANIILVGIFLGYLALGQGSLWLVCGWHAGWNWCQGNVLGIPVSGQGMNNSLLFMAPTGEASATVSGGSFGVEGSAVLTVLLAIAAVLAGMYYYRRARRGWTV
ncbi:MAG: CPBP family intramembrane metalloprotease [Actinobacteria bacterium]|nr:CPBP family intramembrane metalloprotease [Actinomycetota bacterium]